MQQTSFVVAFLGGMAAMFSPCAAMLLPSFFAFAFSRVGTLIGRCLLFLVGLLLTMVPLGLAAGALGKALPVNPQQGLVIGAVVLIVLGLVTASGLSLPGIGRTGRLDPATPVAMLVLGATYGLASGCTGPILGSVLTMAAMGGDPVVAAATMACFALGMTAPLFVLAALWHRLGLAERSWLRPRPVQLGPFATTVSQLVTGSIFVLLGLFLLVTRGNVGGLFDADRQYRLESWIAGQNGMVSMLAVLMLVVALVGVVTWVWLDERERRGAGSPSGSGKMKP